MSRVARVPAVLARLAVVCSEVGDEVGGIREVHRSMLAFPAVAASHLNRGCVALH